MKWSPGSDGLLEIWKVDTGGKQRLPLRDNDRDRSQGKNKFDDGQGNYMKFGIYKWDWTKCAPNDPPERCKAYPYRGPSDTDQRVIYYDELRIADQRGSYDAVAPSMLLGKLDHLILYRPGHKVLYTLRNQGGQFSQVFASHNGIGGYDLWDPADRVFAFDYHP